MTNSAAAIRGGRWRGARSGASNVFVLRCLCNAKLHFLQTLHTPYASHASRLYKQIVAMRSIALGPSESEVRGRPQQACVFSRTGGCASAACLATGRSLPLSAEAGRLEIK